MNQTFDLNRFKNYFAYFLNTGIRHQAAITAALLGFTLIIVVMPVLVFNAYDYAYANDRDFMLYSYENGDPMGGTDMAIYIFMFMLILIVSASMMFSDFGDKASRLDALMLPASSLEKFLTRWIVFVPLTALVSIIGFELIDAVRCLVVELKYNPAAGRLHFIGLGIFTENPMLGDMGWASILSFSCIIAFYVLGAIVWPKFSLIKTFAVGFLLQIIYLSWGSFLASMLTAPRRFDLNEDICYLLLDICLASITAALYVIAYFRLKEIELIQRW